MGHKRKEMDKQRNLVAKYARQFNKAHTMQDRKKAAKRGHIKHKKEMME